MGTPWLRSSARLMQATSAYGLKSNWEGDSGEAGMTSRARASEWGVDQPLVMLQALRRRASMPKWLLFSCRPATSCTHGLLAGHSAAMST